MLGIEESDWEWAASKLGADYHLPSQLDPDEAAAFVAGTLPPLLVDLPPVPAPHHGHDHSLLLVIAFLISSLSFSFSLCVVCRVSCVWRQEEAGKARWAGALRERVGRVHAQMRGQCIMGSASTAVLAKLIPSTLPSAMPTLLVVNVGGMYHYTIATPAACAPVARLTPNRRHHHHHHHHLVHHDGCLWACAATDSRAVLGRSGQAVQVSRDHNAGTHHHRRGDGRKGRVGAKGRRELTSRRVRARQESGGG
jgi:hypothetical protein